MLEINHLTKGFDKHIVLGDLNLNLDEGRIFGLVGINGSGKSTLLRTIAGIYRPDQGEVILDGENTYSCESARGRIAFVSDEINYGAGSTIEAMKVIYKTMYAFDEDAFRQYLRFFELDAGNLLTKLSKGNKRRVALLFALCVHARLILIDEAYDGLEPAMRYKFKQLLARLIEDEHVTVMIAGHSLRELEDICDCFGILEDGRLIKEGDLFQAKSLINRYQLAFDEELDREAFPDFNILHFAKEGKVIQMVIEGEPSEIKDKLAALKPLLLDVLPVNFEELFIYEMERRGSLNE